MNRHLMQLELAVSSRQFLEAGQTGVLELPPTITDAYAAFERAGAALYAHEAVDLQAARDEYAGLVAGALRKDTPAPAPAAVEKVAARARAKEETQIALVAAELLLFGELRAAIPSGDEIVTDHLRPALMAAYDQGRALLEGHGQVLGEPADRAIDTPAAQAWGEFGALASSISALRELHERVTSPAATKDTLGAFKDWTEHPADERLWAPTGGAIRWGDKWRPWRTGARPFTAWMLLSGLSLWVPTAAERDARHDEAYPATTTSYASVGF